MNLIENIRLNAQNAPKRIVLPEGLEERTLRAADFVLAEKIADIILLGNVDDIARKASSLQLENIGKATLVDPVNNPRKEEAIALMLAVRKEKGLTYDEASKLITEPLYLGAVMVKMGFADGEVSGAEHATGDVLRPAFQYVKTMPGITVVSGAFIMMLRDKEFGEDGMIVFADCAVNPDPDPQQLAEIAVATAHTTRSIAGFEPKIAMLSFSTMGSAAHERVDKVKEALQLVKKMEPSLQVDGEMQADAALIEAIGKKKAPGSKIAGKANVLIFPGLEAGNIAYKLVQRLAHAEAVGPILQGMAAPIHDLSRGCSVDDIVNMIAIAVNQAGGRK